MQPAARHGAGRPRCCNLVAQLRLPDAGLLLLAAGRGARATRWCPTVTTMLELARRTSYGYALAELEETLEPHHPAPGRAALGLVPAARLPRPCRTTRASRRFGRQLFDWFRCPILEVFVRRARPGASASWRRCRSTSWARRARRSWRPRSRRFSASPGAPRRQGASRASPWPSCSTRRSGCRRRTRRRPPFRADRRADGPGRRADHQARTSTGSPSTTPCGSARPRTSTTTPSASPSAPSRKACR